MIFSFIHLLCCIIYRHKLANGTADESTWLLVEHRVIRVILVAVLCIFIAGCAAEMKLISAVETGMKHVNYF